MSGFHPFWYLRKKLPVFQKITKNVRIPVPSHFKLASHRIYVDLLRNPRLVYSPNDYEAEDLKIFVEAIETHKLKNLFDVGANIGIFSFVFLNHSTGGKVVAFEPDCTNLSLLRRTRRRQGLETMQIIPKAVGDVTGTISFYLDEISGATGTIARDSKTGTFNERLYGLTPKKVEVEVTTIDEVAEELGPPDIIKIDVEGAENSVLLGAIKTIETHKPFVLVEVTETTRQSVTEFLENYRYKITRINNLQNLLATPEKYQSVP